MAGAGNETVGLLWPMAGLRLILAWFDPRRRLIAVLLGGWGLVIASGGGASAEEGKWLGIPRLERALAAAAIVYVAIVVILLVFAVALNVRRPTERPDRGSQWRLMLLLSLLVLLSTLFPRPSSDDTASVEPPAPVEADEPAVDPSPAPGRNELLALAVVLASAIGVLMWSKRRIENRNHDIESLAPRAELEPLIGRLIDDLELGTDPRSAVIRAYSQFEETLSEHGEARLLTETPMEHVRRALAHLEIDGEPVLRLAGLYEIARFSDHAVSVDDQRRAIAGLTRVRNDLATTASASVSASTSSSAH